MKVWVVETWDTIISNQWVVHSVHDSEKKATNQRLKLIRNLPFDHVMITPHDVK